MFSVVEDGLSKRVVVTMVEGIISMSDLPLYILDGLFDSFGKETTGWSSNLYLK